MLKNAIDRVSTAMELCTEEKDVAAMVKKVFDAEGGTWHCIVGKTFGCSVAHETMYMTFLRINHKYIILFKSSE